MKLDSSNKTIDYLEDEIKKKNDKIAKDLGVISDYNLQVNKLKSTIFTNIDNSQKKYDEL